MKVISGQRSAISTHAACGFVFAYTALALIGCGGPPRANTPFLTSVDLVHMTDRMSESFADDEIINKRTQDHEPWVISIYRVVNHTNQIIRENERWLYIGRLRSRLSQAGFSEDKSLIWIVPPEQWPRIATELGGAQEPPELRMTPTHLLTAEFHALTQTGPGGRSDTYHCAYELLDLNTGEVIWQDAWEVKRAVAGLTFD